MKLGILLSPEFKTALSTLLEDKIPVATAYKLKEVIDTIGEEAKKFEELRLRSLKQFAKLKEDGSLEADNVGKVIFLEGGQDNFLKDINELSDVEVKVPTIALSELGSKLELSVATLLSLNKLIVK